MNTANSVWYGWAFFIACGAGSYYFAKRSINTDRYERQAAENERRMRRNRQIAQAEAHQSETQQKQTGNSKSTTASSGGGGEDDNPKFETKTPFKSKKGDRFS